MFGSSQGNSNRCASVIGVFCLSAFAGVAWAEGWNGNDPSRTTSGQMEGREATSGNPDDMVVGSHDPDERVVDSENLDDHEGEAENPAAMVTGSGEMEEYKSTNLDDLRFEKAEGGAESIMVPGQSEWRPATDPEVVLARHELERAQKRARAALEAYGDAERRDYPRGAARIRIVKERDAAMEALEAAKSALASAE